MKQGHGVRFFPSAARGLARDNRHYSGQRESVMFPLGLPMLFIVAMSSISLIRDDCHSSLNSSQYDEG